jgi:hypothetical protein
MAGMLSLGPGILLFGRIVKAGASSKVSVAVATAVLGLIFGLVTWTVARVTLRLEPREGPSPRG